MTLHDLLAEIGRAGVTASEACRDAIEKRLASMFNEDGSPRTLRVTILDRPVDVPIAALAPGSTLDMDTLCVDFEAEVTLPMTPADKGLKKNATTAKREAVELVPGATLSLDMRQGLIKRSTRFKVSAQFKMGEPPETVEALRDSLTELVRNQLRG